MSVSRRDVLWPMSMSIDKYLCWHLHDSLKSEISVPPNPMIRWLPCLASNWLFSLLNLGKEPMSQPLWQWSPNLKVQFGETCKITRCLCTNQNYTPTRSSFTQYIIHKCAACYRDYSTNNSCRLALSYQLSTILWQKVEDSCPII